MVEITKFNDAIAATEGTDRSLLIGNGFSARHFSYSNLLENSGLQHGSAIRTLFEELDTVDFELVIRSLEDAAVVEKAYKNIEHSKQLIADAQRIREALVTAIQNTHPNNRDDLDYESSATFIQHFGKVFTLNYDLLFYWVNLEGRLLSDEFGKGEKQNGFRGPFKEGAHCQIYNLHGGLHLFQRPDGNIEKRLKNDDGVVAAITETVRTQNRLPLYVAEGKSEAKMRRINSVRYLRYCYDKLWENTGALFIYGHSASDNDKHIYQAIFESRVKKIYFGIYQPTEEKLRCYNAQLSRLQKLSDKDINYAFFDSESANVWSGLEFGTCYRPLGN